MKKARIAELKNRLSQYLDHVKGGGSVLILDRNEPVAEIVPLRGAARGAAKIDGRLARLERRGLIRRGSGSLPEWLGRRKPPRVRGSVLQDLLNERRSGW